MHRIRSWQLIEELSKNHAVHLLSLSFEKPRESDLSLLQQMCVSVTTIQKPKWRCVLDVCLRITQWIPFEVSYCHSQEMQQAVQKIIASQSIDVVYVKRLRSAQFVENIHTPTLLDSTDAMSLFYERASKTVSFLKKPLYMHEWYTYKKYERYLAHTFKNWVVCSPVDADYLRNNLSSDILLSTIPNGVNVQYYAPTNTPSQSNILLISGLFTKFVNIEAAEYFVKDIFPLILEKRPDALLYLVGPAGTQVRKLSQKNIIVTGEVLDMRPYVTRATIVCVPVLTGTGTRNKILQAWSIGRPVVSTPEGAEGLVGTNGEELFIAKSPDEFAEKVLQLLFSGALRENMIRKSIARITSTYDMVVISKDLENQMNQLYAKT